MKITVRTDTPDRLHLVLKPGSLALVVTAIVLTASAAMAVWAMGYATELTVGAGRVHYESRLLGMLRVEEHDIAVREVRAVEVRLADTWLPQYDVFVDHDRGSFRAPFALADGDEKRIMASAMQTAVREPTGQFDHRENAVFVTLILAGTCLGGAIVCLMSLQRVSVWADRNAGWMVVRRYRAIGRTMDMTEVALGEFRGVKAVRQSLASLDSPASYRVEIRRKGKAPVPVAHGPVFTQASADAVSGRIEAWVRQAVTA